ncbi:hypothetical protein [Cereibacter azotoformans]|uniref:hypothetical protein n=1 Tax=Cereibacter azotoformans TaxID=43057 RepID=UPI000C6C969B|nr:hypothetical protein [Cereibacter azotoformans]
MADPATITAAAFGRLVGASREELDGLILSGILPQPTGRDRRLPLREAAMAYLGHLRTQVAAHRADAAAQRAQDARADAASLALAVEQREVIDLEDARAALDGVCGVIATRFQMIPARVTRDRAHRAILDRALVEAQAELAANLSNPTEKED